MTGWASSASERGRLEGEVVTGRGGELGRLCCLGWFGHFLFLLPALFLSISIFYLLNKPRASMWGPVKGWQFTGIELIKIVG